MNEFYNFVVFVPLTHKEQVKAAIFSAGAGKLGNYDCCSFETVGMGQFRALQGAAPFVGEVEKLETVQEAKVECICPVSCIQSVIRAMRQAHPYEEPAFHYFSICIQ